ncbi:MAG: DUF2878 domain-containing protein [Nitrospiraceae bacterium]
MVRFSDNAHVMHFVGFQIGWVACVLGAGKGWPLLGPAAAVILLSLHLGFSVAPRLAARSILTVGMVGILVDTTLTALGLFRFQDHLLPSWLCPPWLIALWFIFASALQRSLNWLSGRWGLAAALGGVFGPISYYAGDRLGALRISHSFPESLLLLAPLWSILFPSLLWLSETSRVKTVKR